jgi:2-dehydro-3-deoxyphosphogluconate aldolase / (4S)-4-hydroxy-2-oxoglutarate aldolase
MLSWHAREGVGSVKKDEICARIEEIGIIPGVRMSSAADARFAAEAVNRGGIPIVEITMTVPEAIEVITGLTKSIPEMIVGAGTVLDIETAKRCLDAGAKFLTSTGLVLEVVEFAVKNEVAVLPGALTPTEVIMAWKAGADMVKIFPCGHLGGENYIRALKGPLPEVPLIASGGVNQQTALNFILAGAAALGIGGELIPRESVQKRQEDRIHELARRFRKLVKEARSRRSAQ